MGQELYSCDTTQIDVFTSARFTRHHACPMDNGWVPVGIYLVARSSRPRKSIHSAAPRPDPTTQGSLQVCRTGYSSFSQVSCCLVVGAIIDGSPPVCQESILFFQRKGAPRRGTRPFPFPYPDEINLSCGKMLVRAHARPASGGAPAKGLTAVPPPPQPGYRLPPRIRSRPRTPPLRRRGTGPGEGTGGSRPGGSAPARRTGSPPR